MYYIYIYIIHICCKDLPAHACRYSHAKGRQPFPPLALVLQLPSNIDAAPPSPAPWLVLLPVPALPP